MSKKRRLSVNSLYIQLDFDYSDVEIDDQSLDYYGGPGIFLIEGEEVDYDDIRDWAENNEYSWFDYKWIENYFRDQTHKIIKEAYEKFFKDYKNHFYDREREFEFHPQTKSHEFVWRYCDNTNGLTEVYTSPFSSDFILCYRGEITYLELETNVVSHQFKRSYS